MVRNMNGRTVVVNVDKDDDINVLKQKLNDEEGIPPQEQRLVFGGKELKPGKTFDDYNITKNSTVHLVLRLVGGC